MNLLHLSMNPRAEAAGWNFPLGIPGFRFADLNRVRRIADLDTVFREELRASDAELSSAYEHYRVLEGKGYEPVAESNLLIRVAPHLGNFVARIFQIESQYRELKERVRQDGRIFEWKKKYLDKQVMKQPPSLQEIEGWDLSELEFNYRALVDRRLTQTSFADDPERELAEAGLAVLEAVEVAKKGTDPERLEITQEDLAIIHKWSSALAFHPALKERSQHFALFRMPETLDYQNLVRIERDTQVTERFRGPKETRRFRDGFKLTDERMTPREAL